MHLLLKQVVVYPASLILNFSFSNHDTNQISFSFDTFSGEKPVVILDAPTSITM
jgi:hypothetical protein